MFFIFYVPIDFLDIFFEYAYFMIRVFIFWISSLKMPILWLGYLYFVVESWSSLYIMNSFPHLCEICKGFLQLPHSPFLSSSAPLLHLVLLFSLLFFFLSFPSFWCIFFLPYSETKYMEYFITHVHCFT